MTPKTDILERLGEKAILLPSLIGTALAANDRIKLRLSLLQEASLQAQSPSREHRGFVAELRAAGLQDQALEDLVSGARLVGAERLFVPGVASLLGGMQEDLAEMLAPLQAADTETARGLAARAETLKASMPSADGDQLDLRAIDALASVSRGSRDSVHLLVMDVHKALNRLAADTAVETLDGARVHSLNERDRRAVSAFMRGLNRTAPLAFGHPGLGTTAVRACDRLTIQNDIGTTDAHVLVIHVDDGSVTVTYTDVHRPRAKFFIALFEGQNVAWSSLVERSAEGLSEDVFYLVSGTFASTEEHRLNGFLEFLGSRIVFLIDWNKGRKALQTFLGKNAAIGLLTWAAKNDLGHRAFLELGGADLIFDAIHRTAAGRIPYGVRLDDALGIEDCIEFLRHVLRDASQGLAAGRTARLIRDEIQADLSRRFETAQSSALAVLVRHLGLTRMLSVKIGDAIGMLASATPEERRSLAARAKLIEEKADRLTVVARDITAQIRGAAPLRPVIDEIDDTTDSLEECAFFLSLVPEADAAAFEIAPLLRLSEFVTDSTGHLIRALEATSRLPQGQRIDAVAALQSIDAVVLAERGADAAARDAFAAFVGAGDGNARVLTLGLEIARALETATDHLAHSALSLRDRVLEELSA